MRGRRFAGVALWLIGTLAEGPSALAQAVSRAPGKNLPDAPTRARVVVRANVPDVTVYQKGGTIAPGPGGVAVALRHKPICTAPCQASLPAGTHTLALALADGAPVEAAPVTLPAGDSRLNAEYHARSGLRWAGWGLMIGASIGGLALMLTAVHDVQTCDSQGMCASSTHLNGPQAAIGAGVLVVGSVAGALLALTPDKASITLTPIDAAPARHAVGSNPALDRVAGLTAGAPGLGLSGRF